MDIHAYSLLSFEIACLGQCISRFIEFWIWPLCVRHGRHKGLRWPNYEVDAVSTSFPHETNPPKRKQLSCSTALVSLLQFHGLVQNHEKTNIFTHDSFIFFEIARCTRLQITQQHGTQTSSKSPPETHRISVILPFVKSRVVVPLQHSTVVSNIPGIKGWKLHEGGVPVDGWTYHMSRSGYMRS